MRVIVASPAQVEFFKAVEFYDDLASGLGGYFVDAFDTAISQISDFPDSGAPYLYGTRRTLLRGFPFAVVYRVKRDVVEVIALAHRSRKPDYWTERA